MVQEWMVPSITDADLQHAETTILAAFDARSTSGLKVLGMGELGLAIGWPAAAPTAVLKRQAPGPDVNGDVATMRKFYDALEDAGALVLPTDVRIISNEHGEQVSYLVQPVVPPEQLTETLFAAQEPSATNPMLVSIRDTCVKVVRDGADGGLSIDAQVTNFAWNGEQVVLIDTTPALIWGPGSGPLYELGNLLTAVPALLRPAAKKNTRRTGDDARTLYGVLRQTALFLYRIDQERWVDPALDCFNEVLDTPLTREDVEQTYQRLLKDLPTVKRLARMQRFWATKVRRQRYDFFITNSFTGEIY